MSVIKTPCFLALFVLCNCTASLDSFDVEDNVEVESGTPTNNNDSDEDTLIVPAILNCESVLMCDSYRLPSETVTMPSQQGGFIEDGIYKAVAGVTQPLAFIFQNGRYSSLSWNLVVGNGNFETNGDFLTTNLETACSPSSDPGGNSNFDPIPTNYRYSILGDDLYLQAECFGPRCDPVIQFRQVTSLCSPETLRSEECNISSCSCHQLVGQQGIPNRADGEDECAI